MLRLVADHHIVTFEDDRVGLTERGRLLCPDHPASLSAAFATVGNSDVVHGLTQTLQTGRAAAPRVLGMGYWDYLAAHPDQQALFDQAMVQRVLASPGPMSVIEASRTASRQQLSSTGLAGGGEWHLPDRDRGRCPTPPWLATSRDTESRLRRPSGRLVSCKLDRPLLPPRLRAWILTAVNDVQEVE